MHIKSTFFDSISKKTQIEIRVNGYIQKQISLKTVHLIYWPVLLPSSSTEAPPSSQLGNTSPSPSTIN